MSENWTVHVVAERSPDSARKLRFWLGKKWRSKDWVAYYEQTELYLGHIKNFILLDMQGELIDCAGDWIPLLGREICDQK